MPYTIGIGALIEGEANNNIRKIELGLADKIGNSKGLGQPPHISVKRSFTVPDLATIAQVEALMHEIAKKSRPFDVGLEGVGSFADKVLYLKVLANDSLQTMHQDYLNAFRPVLPESIGKLEGDKMVFHSTLAMGLTPEEFKEGKDYLDIAPEETYTFTTSINKVGLFLGVDDNSHWVVINEIVLGQ